MSTTLSYWTSNDGQHHVEMPYIVQKKLIGFCEEVGSYETGGILIGRYSIDRTTVIIRDVTNKPSDSSFGRTWFKRGIEGLKNLLRSKWGSGQYYLGEWHFHPMSDPTPSNDDLQSMRKISESPTYACKEPLMVIVGGTPPDKCSLSLTLFISNEIKFLHKV